MKKIDFNFGWLYKRQDDEFQNCTLPHDAMMQELRNKENPSKSAGAYFPGGKYVYAKEFDVPAEWGNKHILLLFEGVYKNSRVFLNGSEIGGAAYGYIPFFIGLDDRLNYGTLNRLEVYVDNEEQPNSRWYTGSGIYRPVWLYVGEKGGIEPEQIRITTISCAPAQIQVQLIGTEKAAEMEILDREKTVASAKGNNVTITLPDAKLWSEESPYLYTCRVTVVTDSGEKETVSETFGIRKIEYSAKGLLINGQETLLRGGCIHHDNGILGAATFDESEYRRVKMLKEVGYNAIRMSHNPASRALLEACDRLGMYVMDEGWDMWYNHKTKYDYATDFMENYQSDIERIVAKDYNHPSVIMYSIGNEVSEPASEKGIELTKKLVNFFHAEDTTRPVTGGFNLMIIKNASKGKGVYKEDGSGRDSSSEEKMSGMNSTMFNLITSMIGTGMNKAANGKKADLATAPALDALDICGYNYASGRYAGEGKLHPDRIIIGSETFPQDIAKNWQMVKKYPYLIGDFMWTAWDYLGEAGIGTWAYTKDAKNFDKPFPWLLADAGAMDILGNPNGELFMAQAAWGRLDKPKIAVRPVNHPGVKPIKGAWRGTNAIPSWSWKGCEGNQTVVEVYSDQPKVELFLNGRSLGQKKTKNCVASYKLKYEAGELSAVSIDQNGAKSVKEILKSAKDTQIHILPEKSSVKIGEVVYIPVTIGEKNIVESNADRKLTINVAGGELLGFGSANPRTEERFTSGTYTTYYGQALAVVRAGNSGKLVVKASDEQGESCEISVVIEE
ncbi:MAG: glycoside hydrolase family 2 TIM barrel-domain containing protein [Eubacteriales bacterium]|nr:glycoside hydrolase family 2 TIM barrel-domain containing protein [Eubacteriales bacterium]